MTVFVIATGYSNGIPPHVVTRTDGWKAFTWFVSRAARNVPITCIHIDDKEGNYTSVEYDAYLKRFTGTYIWGE